MSPPPEPQPDRISPRLAALRGYDVLDTPPEPAFDRITTMAAAMSGMPIAVIALLDRDRVWFKSRVGIAASELPRELAPCLLTVRDRVATSLPDLTGHPINAGDLAPGRLAMACYAGAPLITRDGHVLGTVAVMSPQPTPISPAQLVQLQHLASMAMAELDQRRSHRREVNELASLLRDKDAALARAAITHQQIRHAATHDPLTGIANRALFETRLANLLQNDRPPQAEGLPRGDVALIIVDLDHFKLINEAQGEPAGDQLLRQVAERLRQHSAEIGQSARLGGDDFAIIVAADGSAGTATTYARTLLDQLAIPYDLGGTLVRCTASAGIARFPQDATHPTGLMQAADRALLAAKQAGRNCVRLFDRATQTEDISRRGLEQDLRVALSTGQLRLVYQPIHDMQTGRIVGAEALARWNHPDHGEVPPDVFIPLAEEAGLIQVLGLWALQAACAAAAAWPLPVIVSVNCSPLQFHAPDLAPQIAAILAEAGLPPARLDVEVTERLLLEDAATVMDSMASLRQMGVHLTLDDFGVGHAGLSSVRRFRFDRIKIDKSFVDDLSQPATRAIVEAVLELGRKLQVQTVAEGIEHEAQRDWLAARGCGMAQGYLFARPLSAGAFAARLAAG